MPNPQPGCREQGPEKASSGQRFTYEINRLRNAIKTTVERAPNVVGKSLRRFLVSDAGKLKPLRRIGPMLQTRGRWLIGIATLRLCI